MFSVGELVRHWHMPRTANGQAAKLKLRNGVYRVTARRNDMYDLEHVDYPEITHKGVERELRSRARGSILKCPLGTG